MTVRRAPCPTSEFPALESLEARRMLSGNGLTGYYFNNDDFSAAALTRTDATLNFDWGTGAPAAGMNADHFSVRWQGLIHPPTTETYTFHLSDDDGVRLWVDGQLLIDRWHATGHATLTASINLVAHKRVGILVESREQTGNAGIRLEWSTPTYGRHVIPAANLFVQPAANQQLKLITLGDSVTEGEVGHASYRFWLDRKLTAAGYDVDFLGTRSGNHNGHAPNADPKYTWFDDDHQSRWGAHLDELQASMHEWASSAIDVALIHVGHNDIRSGQSPQSLIDDLGVFIDSLRQYNPSIKIALAKPIKNTSKGFIAEMDQYRALIPGLAAAKTTAQSPVVVVDQYAGFDPVTDTYDTTHPNEAGEKKIAAKFKSAVRSLVGDPPHQQPRQPLQSEFGDLKGQLFNDVNGNGKQDPGEAPLAGRFVFLDYNNNGLRDPGEAVTATTRAGWYLFKNLAAGSYRVRHFIGRFEQVESTTQDWRIARLPSNAIFNFGLRIL